MKKLMMLAVAAAMSFVAQADLIYFMVDSFSFGGSMDFDYAFVGVAKNEGGNWVTDWGTGKEKVYLEIQNDGAGGNAEMVESHQSGQFYVTDPAKAIIANDDWKGDGYAFYIETWKEGGDDPIWTYDETSARTYSQLLAAGSIITEGTNEPNVTVWAVPEPTSGLLVLLGFAALSLRRKQKKVEG